MRARALVLFLAIASFANRPARAAFEWRHDPPGVAVPGAEVSAAGPLGIFVNPSAANGPAALALAASRPYSLDGMSAGAAVFTAGRRIGWGVGAAWLSDDVYGEREFVASVSLSMGPARAGAGVRAMSVSVAGYESAAAFAHDFGVVVGAGKRTEIAVSARAFGASGDRALAGSLTPEVDAAASLEAIRGFRLLACVTQAAGFSSGARCGFAWSPSGAIRWSAAASTEPPAVRSALSLRTGSFTVAAAYEERPPLGPSLSVSIEARP